jgi:RNA polymerase sigma factor (sigma-70 family)
MHSRRSRNLLQQLRRLFRPHEAGNVNDAELLARFTGSRDDNAFAALVNRHAPLVWGVCRRVLEHDHDAEDAFQGTFLVLARKAHSICNKHSIGSWLYGTAHRIAKKARVAAARRRNHETRAASSPVAKTSSELAWRELQAILDEELNRLPEKYRAPFLLCCLERRTKKEAAQELGWHEGTVSSRLAHARKLLQQRLARRGVALSALLCGMTLAETPASATVPISLIETTVKSALQFVTGEAMRAGAQSGAAALAEGLLKAMAAERLKAGVVVLFVLSVVSAGVWALSRAARDNRPEDAGSPVLSATDGKNPQFQQDGPPANMPEDPSIKANAEEVLAVSGHVLDQRGQPVAGANVSVIAGELRQAGEQGFQGQSGMKVLVSGQTDIQGRFSLSLKRPFARRYYGVSLIAAAPGYAPSWYAVSPSQGINELECRLEPGQVARGRLVDAQGVPARGVQVHVVGLVKQRGAQDAMRLGGLPEPSLPWPSGATTDDAGNFLLHNVSPDCDLDLQILDDRFAPQCLVLKYGAKEPTEPVTLSLAPRRIIEGTVVCEDTHLPMPHARLFAQSFGQGAGTFATLAEATADEQGRFRLAPYPGQDVVVSAFPAMGRPYLVVQQTVKWPTGKTLHTEELALPRGVLVRGQVIEAPSGAPVVGATVQYEPRTDDNPNARMRTGAPVIDWWSQDARTGPDGKFQLPVLPGPGQLLVKGPGPDYIHVEISARQLQGGKAGGVPYFPDAVVPLELKAKPADQEMEVTAVLRRGTTLTGQVVGHDGRPVDSAFLLAPTYLPLQSAIGVDPLPKRLPVRNGRFELPGCDLEKTVPIWFIDTRNQEGAFVELSGKPAKGEPTIVRLEPCGSAMARFVDSAGRPLPKPAVLLHLLMRPGPELQESIDKQVQAFITFPPARLMGSSCITEGPQEGSLDFSSLIPGATYVVQANEGTGFLRKATFQVQAGRRLVLPDIVLKPPSGREH